MRSAFAAPQGGLKLANAALAKYKGDQLLRVLKAVLLQRSDRMQESLTVRSTFDAQHADALAIRVLAGTATQTPQARCSAPPCSSIRVTRLHLRWGLCSSQDVEQTQAGKCRIEALRLRSCAMR